MIATRTHCAAALLAALLATPAFAQYSTPMHDVENPDHFVFMQNASVEIDPPFVNNFMFFPTAAGKRYFLQELSMICTTASTTDVMTQVYLVLNQKTTAGNVGISGPALNMVKTGPAFGGGSVWAGSMQLNAFSDPDGTPTGGQTIFLNIFHTESQNIVDCNGYVSGHTLAQ
jgi:hypothetical protein